MSKYDRQSRRGLNTNSKAWKMLREQVLVRDGYQCQVCKKMVFGTDAHVDHRDNDSFNQDMDNLWVLCRADHSAKTLTEQQGKVWDGKPAGPVGCDEDGWPL